MKKYADLQILVLDSGGNFVSTAERLARDFGKVYYFCPNYGSCPSLNRSMIGEGLEGVTVIEQWFYKWNDYKAVDGDYDFNKIDLFVFCDVYMGDIQMHLVQDCNKTVWGSRKAEELELLRYETKLKLAKIGLPVTPTELCNNYQALLDFLEKEKKPKFLKLSWFRGIMESGKYEDMFKSVRMLGGLKKSLEECYADEGDNSMELLAEEPIESKIEIGVDPFTIDGKFPNEIGWGVEQKNQIYVSKHSPFNELPEQLQYTTQGLGKLIAEYGDNGCRSWVCSEIRIDEKSEGHLIDITMRQGEPPSELQQEWIENYSEIVYEGAKGNLVEPIYKTKYAVQVAIYSPYTDTAQEIEIPKEIYQWVKLYSYCGIDKIGSQKYGIIPSDIVNDENLTEIGYVVGIGDTLGECWNKAREYSEKIIGSHLEFQFDAVKDIEKTLKVMKKAGIDF